MKDNINEVRIKAVTGLIKGNENDLFLSATRDETKLSLRKQKLDQLFLNKRKLNQLKQNGSLFIPYINMTQIPQDILDSNSYSNEKERLYSYISLIKRIFPKNTNLAYYLLNQIFNIISNIISEKLSSQFQHHLEILANDFINNSIIESLHVVLENNVTKNKIILFQVIKIFLQISMITDIKLMQKFITVPYLYLYNDIFDLLTKSNSNMNDNSNSNSSINLDNNSITTNQEILSVFIQFLGNIIEGDEYIQNIFYTYNIYSKIFILLKHLTENDFSLFKDIISFYVQFSYPQKFPNDTCVYSLYNIFSQTITTYSTNYLHYKDILFDALTGLYFISYAENSPSLVHMILNDNLFQYLFSIYDENNSILLILRTLLNLTSVLDENCDLLYTKDISDFLLNSIIGVNSFIQIKIETIWVMENICLGTDMNALFKYDNDFYEKIIEYVLNESVHLKIECEIVRFIVVCWNNTTDVMRLITDSIVEMICVKMLKSDLNDEMISMLIIMIDIIYKCGLHKQIEKIVNTGLRDVFDKWLLHNCEEIRNETGQLVEKIFN